MANMEKRSDFENEWKDAFEDAEITPSANLWKNIDNQLTMQENGKYRKGFIFYRSLAAACFICLLGLGYYVLQNSIENGERELANLPAPLNQSDQAQQNTSDELALEDSSNQSDAQATDKEIETSEKHALDQALAQQNSKNENTLNASEQGAQHGENKVTSKNNVSAFSLAQDDASSEAVVVDEFSNTVPSNINTFALAETKNSVATPAYLASLGPVLTEEKEADWTKDINRLYRVPQEIIDDKKNEQKTAFFAGVNLATNYFDPNFSSSSPNTIAAAAMSPTSDGFVENNSLDYTYYQNSTTRNTPSNSGLDNKPQLSLSYGVDVGIMLTEHISLESGLDYGRMNASTQTSWVSEDYSQDQRIPLLVSNSQASANYRTQTQFTPQELELTNSFAFLSVPLKLGYNLGFERIRFNLSSGVAANFFLNNRLTDDNGQLNTVNIDAGESSPYRPVYYSGVVSGGFNYMIASNYAVSVSPNYNFSLNSLTDSGNSFSSQPNAFGVDFGLRYNFR